MDFLTVFFSTVVILALAGVVSALRGLNRSVEHLLDKLNKLIGEIHEVGPVVYHLQQSVEGISQKISKDKNRDQANPDLIEVLEDIRDK